MSPSREAEIRASFWRQAEICRTLDSPLTGKVLETIAERLRADSVTGKRLFAMTGDPTGAGEALSLRLAGGLHALARSGRDEALAAAYRGEGDVAAAVAAALEAEDDFLAGWLASPPQTNEPGRAALIVAGLLVTAARHPLPIELLEIGSSAGLVLNLEHYRYDIGGLEAGQPTSPLLIAPRWKGRTPPEANIAIVARRGVDRNPIYLSSPEAAERLLAYVWADQPERMARLEAAIDLARAFPPPIVAGEAADWVEARLAAPQAEGVLRILFHTITLQYLSDDQRARVVAAIDKAGAEADAERPLGWLAFELNADRTANELRLKLWPGGEDIHLANAHPHGASVEWLA